MSKRHSRRAVLAAATTAATAALAGCAGGEQPPLDPRVPENALEGDNWRHLQAIEERTQETVEVAMVEQTVKLHLKGDVYANPRPVERVSQRFEQPPMQPPPAQFVPMKMRTDPPVHRLTGVSNTLNEQLIDQVEQRAMSELGSNDLQNLRRVDEDEIDIEAAGSAVHRQYRAEVEYARDQVEVSGRQVTIEPGTFQIEAQLALWPYEGLLALAGGAYPGEPGTIELTANGSTQSVDLGLEPQFYRESVRNLTTLVT
jgi:hypothetical protein